MKWKEAAKYRATNADKLFGCVDRIKPEDLQTHIDPLYEKPRRKKPTHREEELQVLCVRWFRMQYRELGLLLFAVPNGERRDKITGARLKKQGVVSGVADLFLSVPNKTHHGLYIEMKTPEGRQQTTQKTFEASVKAQGYDYCICRTLEGFICAVREYLEC